jgi:hypothetical protein
VGRIIFIIFPLQEESKMDRTLISEEGSMKFAKICLPLPSIIASPLLGMLKIDPHCSIPGDDFVQYFDFTW